MLIWECRTAPGNAVPALGMLYRPRECHSAPGNVVLPHGMACYPRECRATEDRSWRDVVREMQLDRQPWLRITEVEHASIIPPPCSNHRLSSPGRSSQNVGAQVRPVLQRL